MGKGEGPGVDRRCSLSCLCRSRMVKFSGASDLAFIVCCIMDEEIRILPVFKECRDHRPCIAGIDNFPARARCSHHVRRLYLPLLAVFCHPDRLAALEPSKKRPGWHAKLNCAFTVEPARAWILFKHVPECRHAVAHG